MTDKSSGAYTIPDDVSKGAQLKAEETQQQQSRAVGQGQGDARKPPFDPVGLALLLEENTTHAKSVHVKSRNVAGYGFDIVPHGDVGPDDASEEERERVRDFWYGDDSNWQVGPAGAERAGPIDVLEMAWTDFEAIGWLSVELLTQMDGTPVGAAYVPAQTIRKRKNGHGFVQIVDGQTRFYGVAGDRYRDEPIFVDRETGEHGPPEAIETPANELLFKRNPSPLYEHYGAPDVIPAVPSIEADLGAQKFQIDFFDHDGVPRMAVIVEGGELDDESWDQLQKTLKKTTEDSHRTAVLEVDKLIDEVRGFNDGEGNSPDIRIEPLTAGTQEEASFLELRQFCEHEILKAHDVPPVEAGQIKSGSFSTDAEQQRKSFIEETIAPKQQSFSDTIYEVIHKQALDVSDWTIEFQRKDPDQRLIEAETLRMQVQAVQGAITVDEARERAGLEPLGPPMGEMLLAELGGGGMGGPGGIGQTIEETIDDRIGDLAEDLRDEFRAERRIQAGGLADVEADD